MQTEVMESRILLAADVQLAAEFVPGTAGSSIDSMVSVEDSVYLSVNDGTGYKIWQYEVNTGSSPEFTFNMSWVQASMALLSATP